MPPRVTRTSAISRLRGPIRADPLGDVAVGVAGESLGAGERAEEVVGPGVAELPRRVAGIDRHPADGVDRQPARRYLAFGQRRVELHRPAQVLERPPPAPGKAYLAPRPGGGPHDG